MCVCGGGGGGAGVYVLEDIFFVCDLLWFRGVVLGGHVFCDIYFDLGGMY